MYRCLLFALVLAACASDPAPSGGFVIEFGSGLIKPMTQAQVGVQFPAFVIAADDPNRDPMPVTACWSVDRSDLVRAEEGCTTEVVLEAVAVGEAKATATVDNWHGTLVIDVVP